MAQFEFDVVIDAAFRDVMAHFQKAVEAEGQPGVISSVSKTGRNTFVETEADAELLEMLEMLTGDRAEATRVATVTTTYAMTAAGATTKVHGTVAVSDDVVELAEMSAALTGEPSPIDSGAIPAAAQVWATRMSRQIQIQKAMADRAKGGLE